MQTRPFRFSLCLAGFALIGGCATTPSSLGSQVRDADERLVEQCQFVAQVHGSSGWGGLAASTGVENAKNEARDKAGKMGATHIVWDPVKGSYTPNVSGRAYRC